MHFLDIKSTKVPALGFGTYPFTGSQAVELVDFALGLGYRHIDTAQMYNNEGDVGTALRDSGIPREELFLTTKVWPHNFSRKRFAPSVEESIRKLKTPYVDLLLLHWPSAEVPLEETLEELMKVRDRGLARQIGVSNFTVPLLRQSLGRLGDALFANQVEYHVFLDQDPVLAVLRQAGIMLTAYSPVAKGRVSGHPVLKEIGQRHGKTEVQVALRWLIQQKNVSAIPRSSRKEGIRENFDIFDFALTPEEMEQLFALGHRGGRLIDPDFAPEWD